MTLVRDYFGGYRAVENHPCMTSTGSEGCCDVCGLPSGASVHRRPWVKVVPEFAEALPDPERANFIGDPY